MKSGFSPEIVGSDLVCFYDNKMASKKKQVFKDPDEIQRFMDIIQSDFEESDIETTDGSSGMFDNVSRVFFVLSNYFQIKVLVLFSRSHTPHRTTFLLCFCR